ncbi:MAG: 5'/3'-nucleotidase SurE [Halobacteriaceae archaeon]
MSDDLTIMLTNDDGIDSPGIRALYDGLVDLGEVFVVAPSSDQSAVGRSMSNEVTVQTHELGYSIAGTPSDCVVAGLEALGPYPDIVISGCNKGANIGMYVLGRSGTVSAAVEAAYFGIPAISTSLYVPESDIRFEERATDPDQYSEAVRATKYLVEHTMDAGVFEQADYLNVNAPMPQDSSGEMVITSPSHAYDMDATSDGDTITLHDRMWERMATGDIPDPPGTDRYAIVNGDISVSPLTAPHSTQHHEALDGLAETF